MVVSGISGLLLPFLLSLPSLGLTTLGTDVDGWGGLYHDGAAGATDGPLLRRTPASNLLQEPPDGGPDRLHHPFIARRMALRPAAVFIGGGFTFSPAARASESPMAMAWGRDSTLGPFFDPEWRVPCLNSCITFPTLPTLAAMSPPPIQSQGTPSDPDLLSEAAYLPRARGARRPPMGGGPSIAKR